MPLQTEVRTETTSDNDRMLMRTVLRKRLNKKLLIYLPLVFVGIGGLILINTFDVRFDMSEASRGTWNVILVVLGAFPFRLAIGEVMSYQKDLGNFQIKTAKGLVREVKGRSITIGNYEFNASALDDLDLQPGDQVELRAGYKTSQVFFLKKELPAHPSTDAMA
ncbi:MAG TPA: hypothetical protein VGO45_04275 [Bacteroidia bacterium]|nr:hypothetical protein [Bacteroidia bacterium]